MKQEIYIFSAAGELPLCDHLLLPKQEDADLQERKLFGQLCSQDNYLILILKKKQGGVLHHNQAIDQEMRQL